MNVLKIENKGMVSIKSHHGYLLQAYTDGVLHASQKPENRGTEETWFIFDVTTNEGTYHAFANYRTGNVLSVNTGPILAGRVVGFNSSPFHSGPDIQYVDVRQYCARAVQSSVVSVYELWSIEQGILHGAYNAIALKNFSNNHYLGAHEPGHDTECGGEVGCGTVGDIPANQPSWPCWWVMEPADKPPPPGQGFFDFLLQEGKNFLDSAIRMAPAEIAKLIGAS
jgi:hypothetical protein